jgi:hypothetical protein
MHRRVILALAVAASLSLAGLTGTAGADPEVSVSGYTNACFGSACVAPNTASTQVAVRLGLAYVNATFAGTTAAGGLGLGGSPGLPNVDNLGSFILFDFPASYDGLPVSIRVRMAGSTVAVDGVLRGADTSGVVVDFDNTAHAVTMADGTVVSLSVQDVAVPPVGTVAVSGLITTGGTAAPIASSLQPSAAVPPVTVTGSSDRGGTWSGTTAGGVFAFSAGTVSFPEDPVVYDGQSFPVTLSLTAPVAQSIPVTAALSGTVLVSATGGVVIDFPDPVAVLIPEGRMLIGLNDLALSPGHVGDLTGEAVLPPPNRPPVAVDDAVTRKMGNHGVSGNVLTNDHDPEGDPMRVELVSPPLVGTVVLGADGAFTYVPRPPNQGGDSFTYRVSDGLSWSAPSTVTISVGKR